MTKNDLKKLIKNLTKEVLAEDFKGEPDHEAEVESDNLTATLSEDDKVADIADLFISYKYKKHQLVTFIFVLYFHSNHFYV